MVEIFQKVCIAGKAWLLKHQQAPVTTDSYCSLFGRALFLSDLTFEANYQLLNSSFCKYIGSRSHVFTVHPLIMKDWFLTIYELIPLTSVNNDQLRAYAVPNLKRSLLGKVWDDHPGDILGSDPTFEGNSKQLVEKPWQVQERNFSRNIFPAPLLTEQKWLIGLQVSWNAWACYSVISFKFSLLKACLGHQFSTHSCFKIYEIDYLKTYYIYGKQMTQKPHVLQQNYTLQCMHSSSSIKGQLVERNLNGNGHIASFKIIHFNGLCDDDILAVAVRSMSNTVLLIRILLQKTLKTSDFVDLVRSGP